MKTFDSKRFRRDKNITQVELAGLLSCKQSFISAVESGARVLPPSMINILKSKFGNIDDYITTTKKQDIIVKNVALDEFVLSGAEVFSRQIIKMMNDKLIAPYEMLTEKEAEIERLNRRIGKLEALLEASKKTDTTTIDV